MDSYPCCYVLIFKWFIFFGVETSRILYLLAMAKSFHILLGVTKQEDNTFTSIVAYHSYLLKKTIVEDDAIVIFSIFRM